MSNQNTVAGYYNIPAQVITVNTEIALLVPAAGVFPSLPSPTLPVGSGLSISPSPDIVGIGSTFDVRRFAIKLAVKVANPGTGNLTVKLYQVPFANVGVISAAGSVTSGGAPGSGDVLFDSQALTAPANPSDFFLEYQMIWSSAVNRLDGYHTGLYVGAANGTLVAQAAASSNGITSGVTLANALNFLPSFTFATANAGNSVQVSEFVIERI